MTLRLFWPIMFVHFAQGAASVVTDCLQRSGLSDHTWSDAAAPVLSIKISGLAGSYSILELENSILVGTVATMGGSDSTCYALSTPGDYVQFVAGTNCNTINLWQSAATCSGTPTYSAIAQPPVPVPSDLPSVELSESSSPSAEPSGSIMPAGDAAQTPSDPPSPVSDVPSPGSSTSAPSPASPISPAASGALVVSSLPVSPTPSDKRCKPIDLVIVPGPLDYISGLPVNGLHTLASTVLNESGEGSCPTTAVGTETVHFVDVTPGLSWLVTLIKGHRLKVTGWGNMAKQMVGFLLDYTASDDCFAALKVQKPAVPSSHTIVFAINLDRVDYAGQLLNSDPMTVEVDVNVPIVAVYIFHDKNVGQLLQKEHGSWRHANGKLYLNLSHTSAIVAYTDGNVNAASSATSQGQSNDSNSALYALLALVAIPVLLIAALVAFLIYRRRAVAMENAQLNYYPYSYNPQMAPPPTPVQCASGSFMMVV